MNLPDELAARRKPAEIEIAHCAIMDRAAKRQTSMQQVLSEIKEVVGPAVAIVVVPKR